MSLSEKAIHDFANIWLREFGEQLPPDLARIEANNLLELAWRLTQPRPGERTEHSIASPEPQ